MSRNWKKTELPYIEYYQDPSKPKYGRKFDTYYRARFWALDKKQVVCFGWMSSGWTPRKCYDKALTYKANMKAGQRPTSWAEEQQMLQEQAQLDKAEREAQLKRSLSFKEFFEHHYLPGAEVSKKPETVRKEKEHVANWIHPATGDLPMCELDLGYAQRIRDKMAKAGRSPRSQQYVLRTFSTVWNAALDEGIVTTPCPTKQKSFKLPRVDNERKRYLTYEEAEKLLATVRKRSKQAHDMALVSLEAGLRFGEVASLTWGCVDFKNQVLHVLRTKGGRDRTVPMTERLSNTLQELFSDQSPAEPVFPNRLGRSHTQVPTLFKKALKDSGVNDNVEDPKLRASFHTLRHTFASRLVQSGVDLHTVKVLLGHSTPAVTQRYSHLRQDDLKAALKTAEKAMQRAAQARESKGKVLDIGSAKAKGE